MNKRVEIVATVFPVTGQKTFYSFSYIVPKAKKITLNISTKDIGVNKLLHLTKNNRSDNLIYNFPIPDPITVAPNHFISTSTINFFANAFIGLHNDNRKIDISEVNEGEQIKGVIEIESPPGLGKIQIIAIIEN